MSAIVKERRNVLNVEVSKKEDRRNVKGNDRNVKGNSETLDLKRGMIVFVDLGSVDEGRSSSVQKGKRPCLIVSNNANNKFSGNLSVIVLTSKMTKKPLPTHVLLTTDEVSCLKVLQKETLFYGRCLFYDEENCRIKKLFFSTLKTDPYFYCSSLFKW